jgi:hypothetical protein
MFAASTVFLAHDSLTTKTKIINHKLYHRENTAMACWTSKLGNKYLKADIDRDEMRTKSILDSLRRLPQNRKCADCGSEPTVWASVNLGAFLCLRCGSIHRGIGTHISIPKGCTGTYFWGPDEVEQMRVVGNDRVNVTYGGSGDRPPAGASDFEWREFIINKYSNCVFAPLAKRDTPDIISEMKSTTSENGGQDFISERAGPDLMTFDNDVAKDGGSASADDFFANFGL